MEHAWIAGLAPGTFAGIYRIREAHVRTDRKGGYYLDLTLFDRSGALPAKFWKAHPNMLDAIKPGLYLKVQGRVEVASEQLQIVLDEFLLAEDHEVEASSYERSSDADSVETLREIWSLLESIEDADLQAIAEAFLFDDDFVEHLLVTPGSYRRHHAWSGGLIDHILSMMNLALRVAEHYPALNRDLLLVGAFVHDLGKVLEFDWQGEPQSTLDGQMLGHIPLGIELLTAKAAECHAFPPATLTMLKHMVYAHHESARYGSPKAPLFPEALALQSIEALDSRLSTMFETLGNPAERELEAGTFHKGHSGARWAFKPNADSRPQRNAEEGDV